MKTLEQLGISKTPWKATGGQQRRCGSASMRPSRQRMVEAYNSKCDANKRLADKLAKQREINKELVDELAKQREYDAKLEADFAALYKEKERLRNTLRVIAKQTEGYADNRLRAIHSIAADEAKETKFLTGESHKQKGKTK